jgi:hypothetical protein
MSDTTALSAALPQSHGPTPRASAAREIDMYAESLDLRTGDDASAGVEGWFGKDGFDFKDLLDIVNPLQHLPVVGTIYRAVTGDALAPGPRILGGALFGGIAGFVSAIANAVFENETGKDFGDTALALVTDKSATGPAVAAAAVTAPAASTVSGATHTPATATAAPFPAVAAAAAPITPTAPSPLAIAGHAKAPGIPFPAVASATEDPVSALINAHAVVPATHRPGITGLPATNYRAAFAMPDGKTVPIQFKSKAALAAAQASEPAPTATAAEKAVAAALPPAGRLAAANAPRPLLPASTANSAAGQSAEKAGAGTAPDVAVLMRQALDKYETLMKSRTAPSISDKI